MKSTILCTLLLVSSISFAGGRDSGGGDMCEDRFKIVRDDLANWILKGGPNGLKIPQGITVQQYSKVMFDQIGSTKVGCVGVGDPGYPVNINGKPKVCRFDMSSTENRITCDFAKFNGTSESDQYILVHHEYAGLAGIEPPNQDDSSYEVSNQISGYLVNQLVKKLAVNPKEASISDDEDCYSASSGDIESNLLDDARNLRISCVKKTLSYDWFKKYQNINVKDNESKTPLHLVATFETPRICAKTNYGETCKREWAIKRAKALEIAKILLAAGAKTETRDKYKDTPINSAAYSFPEMVILLVNAGGNIKSVGSSGDVVLHDTTNPQIIDLYIKAGGNLNKSGRNGWSPMAQWTNWAVNLERSYDWKAKATVQDFRADISKYKNAISQLVAAGADINGGKVNAMAELKRLMKLSDFQGIDINELQTYKFLKSMGAKE